MVNVGSVQTSNITIEFPQGVFPVDLKPIKPSVDYPLPKLHPEPRNDNRQDGSKKVEQSNIPLDKEQMKKVLEVVNNVMRGLNVRLEFGLYGNTDQLFVKIIDRANNNVVKVIPSAELLELKEKITEAVGVILDQNA